MRAEVPFAKKFHSYHVKGYLYTYRWELYSRVCELSEGVHDPRLASSRPIGWDLRYDVASTHKYFPVNIKNSAKTPEKCPRMRKFSSFICPGEASVSYSHPSAFMRFIIHSHQKPSKKKLPACGSKKSQYLATKSPPGPDRSVRARRGVNILKFLLAIPNGP